MAFPSVKDPKIYVTIWLPNFLSLVANLIFLTDPWFSFRIWIKAFLKSLFKCHPVCCPPNNEADYNEVEDERGHSNNKPGYHRRQVRFYYLKVGGRLQCCRLRMFSAKR